MAIFYEYLYYNKLELDLFVRNIYGKRLGYLWEGIAFLFFYHIIIVESSSVTIY